MGKGGKEERRKGGKEERRLLISIFIKCIIA
jgi:hypothetical protein